MRGPRDIQGRLHGGTSVIEHEGRMQIAVNLLSPRRIFVDRLAFETVWTDLRNGEEVTFPAGTWTDDDLEHVAAEVERCRALLREAHDAMMAWHLVHGSPLDLSNDEARRMGAACRAISEQVLFPDHAALMVEDGDGNEGDGDDAG